MHTAHNAVLVQADNLVISGGNFQQNVQVEPGTISFNLLCHKPTLLQMC